MTTTSLLLLGALFKRHKQPTFAREGEALNKTLLLSYPLIQLARTHKQTKHCPPTQQQTQSALVYPMVGWESREGKGREGRIMAMMIQGIDIASGWCYGVLLGEKRIKVHNPPGKAWYKYKYNTIIQLQQAYISLAKCEM